MEERNTQLEETFQDCVPDYTIANNQTFLDNLQQDSPPYSTVYQDILVSNVEQSFLPDSTMFYESLHQDYSPDSTIFFQQGDSGDQRGDSPYTDQVVTSWQNMVTDQVTDSEQVKVMDRRRRNRIAANKCRNKKKEKTNLLIMKAKLEEERNMKLRLIVAKLKEEKNILVKMLVEDGWRDFSPQKSATNNLDPNFVPEPSILEDTDCKNIFNTQFDSADHFDMINNDSFHFIS